MGRKQVIKTPQMDALIYDILYRMPLSQRRELPIKYQKALGGARGAKWFCNNCSLEAKLELLAVIGATWNLHIGNEKVNTPEWLQSVLNDYENKKPFSALSKLTSGDVSVTSNKEFLFLLSLMAQTSDTAEYVANFQYNKIGYSRNKWSIDCSIAPSKDFQEVKKSVENMAEFSLHTIMAYDLAQQVTGASQHEIKILLFLFKRRNTYLKLAAVAEAFAGVLKERFVARTVRSLEARLLITLHGNNRNKSFTISAIGITVINKLNERIMKSLNFT